MIKVENGYFKIDTPNTTYLFKVNPLGILEHIYYGKKIPSSKDYSFIEEQAKYGGGTLTGDNEYAIYEDCASLEASSSKRGDSRETFLNLSFDSNDREFVLKYKAYRISNGVNLDTLPSSHDKAQTLSVILEDENRGIEVTLNYSVFEDTDVIVRNSSIKNVGKSLIKIERIMSSSFDMIDGDFTLVTLNGAWAKERQINEAPLAMGITKVSSNYGFSSAQTNPFTILKKKETTFVGGEAYGFNLLYSGNHMTTYERTMYHKVRVMAGINDYSFSWTLNPNAVFEAPEATLCYSYQGINKLSHEYHQFVRNHIIRSEFKDKEKPILINNWEGTYFNFTEESLLGIAKKAKEVGIEMLVLDDGWFGKRNSDSTSLGDWYPNLEKLPEGIKGLSEKVHSLGLKFGLWFEPEMISPDSDLYRSHPEWAIKHKSYVPLLSRNQLVLDLTNEEVVKYIGDVVSSLIKDAKLDYVKWDCNRNIGDYYNENLDNQEEFLHRYMLGFYKLVKHVTEECPNVLFESCSAGGNRADLGLLCYMPQFWCSDNSDQVSRMMIQEGTLLCYPQCCIGAHVSSSLSHQTLRTATYDNKFNVACIGAFGYELDLTKLNERELQAIKDQITWFKKHRKLLQLGDFYQIKSFYTDNTQEFVIVSSDKSEAMYFVGNKVFMPYACPTIIKPIELNNEYVYEVSSRAQYQNALLGKGEMCESSEWTILGETFMNAGIRLPYEWLSGNGPEKRIMEDFGSRLYYIEKKEA
ncbi:MAG: alpha-galactosidase [Bacilli bacterium]|nr:alpha-galactosidase [Bacilli bacterium]